MRIVIIKGYTDSVLRRDVKKGEMLTVKDERGAFLIERGKAKNITFELEAAIAEKDARIAELEAALKKASK